MINDRAGLALATLIFFIFALPASFIVCRKHGFGRNSGWYFLLSFSLFRIAGSIAEIVAVNQPSTSSLTAAAVLASSGFSTLLMAQIGLLQRINEGIPSDKGRIPPLVFRVMVLALIVGIILSIVGGVDQSESSPKTQSNGRTYSHAAAGLFAAAFGIMEIESLFTAKNFAWIIPGDRKLLFAIGAAFPFLLVHLVYVELSAFQVNPALFNSVSGSVVVQAFMSSLEDYIIVALFLVAGFAAPVLQRSQLLEGKSTGDPEAARKGMFALNVGA